MLVIKPLSRYLALAFLILLSSQCKRKSAGELDHGIIRFEISYEQSRVGGYSTAVLPQEMKMEFNKNMVKNTIEGGLGFFRLVNTSDLRNYQNTTWLKFIDKKYIYKGEKKEVPCCFGMLDGMELEFTEMTKKIAGFNCRHARVNFPGNESETFDIWYTQELNLYHPNGNTPYKEIPGVLLEFKTLMGNAEMHMTATSFEPKQIPMKEFQPPKNYRAVSKAEMENILNALMN